MQQLEIAYTSLLLMGRFLKKKKKKNCIYIRSSDETYIIFYTIIIFHLGLHVFLLILLI